MDSGHGGFDQGSNSGCPAEPVDDDIGFGLHVAIYAIIAMASQAIFCDNRFCDIRTDRPTWGVTREELNAILDERGVKNVELVRILGIEADKVSKARDKKGTRRWSAEEFAKLKVWLEQGTLDPDRPPETDGGDLAYVDVNVLPSYAGAGGGGTGEGDKQVAKLPRRLIEEELRGKASDFELIDVRGDSMEPDFHHGDQILVDKRDRNPRQPGPFALWDDDGYVVKLVERVPQRRGWYRIFSANSRYSPYEIEETETTILGRPVWFARRL